MLPIALVLRAPWPASRRRSSHIAIAGVLLHGGYLAGVFTAIYAGMSAGLAALIVGLQPVLTAVVAAPLLRERVTPRQWLGLALGFGGVALVVAQRPTVGGLTAFSFAMSLIALLSITAGTVYQKRFCGAFDLRTGSVIQFVAAGLALAPFALLFEHEPVRWTGEFVFAMALAGARALDRGDLAADAADPARRRNQGGEPVLSGAAVHRGDRVPDVRRARSARSASPASRWRSSASRWSCAHSALESGLAPDRRSDPARRAMIEFRTETKRARLHDPRQDFALAEIESEVRHDPLTGETARICHFAMRAPPAPDLAAIDELSRPGCPFCPERIESDHAALPRRPRSRRAARRGAATVFPNLFPYDDVSGDRRAVRRALPSDGRHARARRRRRAHRRARFHAGRGQPRFAGRDAYGIVTWNYMPAAGGTQVHPHMQVIVTTTPGNAVGRQLAAAAAFRARTGRVYAEVLLEAERRGPRWIGDDGRVAWLAPFTPTGVLGDAMAVIRGRSTLAELDDADIADFAATLVRVLRAFAARGLWSFNLCLMPDAFGAAPRRHWLTARLLPRFYLNPKLHVSDASYLQLLLEERFAMLTPEEVGSDLRARFGTA